MDLLPLIILPLILAVASLFSRPVWESALVLLVGGILAPGKRTVSAVLQVMRLKDEPHFQNYHWVLSRAIWSSRHASRILLFQLVQFLTASGVLVMGIDGTIEYRWGNRIAEASTVIQ